MKLCTNEIRVFKTGEKSSFVVGCCTPDLEVKIKKQVKTKKVYWSKNNTYDLVEFKT